MYRPLIKQFNYGILAIELLDIIQEQGQLLFEIRFFDKKDEHSQETIEAMSKNKMPPHLPMAVRLTCDGTQTKVEYGYQPENADQVIAFLQEHEQDVSDITHDLMQTIMCKAESELTAPSIN